MDKNTLIDLNIPNLLLEICPDEKIVEAVMADLQALQQEKTAIIERQREISDFINNPELLSLLVRQIRRLDDLKEKHKTERLSVAKTRAQSALRSAKDQLGPVMSNIQLVVKHLEECIKLYSDLPVYLQDYTLASEFLVSFKKSLKKIIDSNTQKRLKDFAKDIQALQNSGAWHQSRVSVTYSMDDSLNKLSYHISQLLFDLTPASAGRWLLLQKSGDSVIKLLRRKEVKRKQEEFELAEDFFSYSIAGGLTHLMDMLSLFTQNLQKPFEYIQKNLPLYKFGITLAAHYKTRGTPYCFPKIVEPGGQTLDIQPLTLLYGGDGADHFPVLQKHALLQMFAQSGLPIAEEQAQVAIVSGLFAQFSSNELVLGRFEEEVREMSAICHKIKPHGMVLFHEVFQSTAYEDIAEPFAQIIDYLINLPCTVVMISHNNFLVERLSN